ncbi:MAG: TetR/AcrR family transcriptional regulator [Nocardioidaceae bacterium]
MRLVKHSARPYRSPLRDAQAAETRRRIVSSAGELFLAQGYPGTTVADVARRAEVSADSVYKTFGSKREILKQVLDSVIGGDDEDISLLDRPDPQALRAETDQHRQVAVFAAGMTEQLERVRPMDDVLRGAAAVDAEVAELRSDVQLRQRRTAMRAVVSWIAARGPLRDEMSEDEAAAVLWTLTSPEVHGMLRDTWRWPRKRYEDWLRDTLTATLLG